VARFVSFGYPRLVRVGKRRQGRVAELEALRQRRAADPKYEHHERGPNLKYEDEDEDEDQDNAQLCGLGPLAWHWCRWRSGRTALQLEQRANPSIERTVNGLRPSPSAHVKR
jgi:hypothetical protein